MFSQRRVFEIHIPRLVVAAIAISSVSLSLYLSVTNAAVGADTLDHVCQATVLLPWLAGKGNIDICNPFAPRYPLYGVATLAMSLFVDQIDLAGNLVSSLSWAATLPIYFLVCRKLYGVEVAYLSTALLATNRWMIRLSYTMQTEVLYVLLSVSSLLACAHLVGLLEDSTGRVSKKILILSLSAGCVLTLLFLTGVEGTAVTLSVFAFLCVWAILGRRTEVGVAGAIMGVTGLVMSLSSLLVLRHGASHWILTSPMERLKGRILSLAMPEPRTLFLMTYLKRTYQYAVTFSSMLGSVGVAMIVLWGMMTILPPVKLTDVRKERLLPALFLSPLPFLFLHPAHRTRYAVPYIFILIMWVGVGAVQVGQRLGKRHATLALGIVLIAISILHSWDVLSWPYSHVHLTMKQLGLWMRDNLPAQDLEGETILGRKGAIIADFYTGGKLKVSGLWGLEFSTPQELVGYMKANDIRYLLVDAVYTLESHPDLAFLLWDFQAARRLGLEVMRVEEGRTNTSVLYELRSVTDID